MSIAIAKNHMAEMNMLGMLAVLDKTLNEATRDRGGARGRPCLLD
jgi:hypothetical protein